MKISNPLSHPFGKNQCISKAHLFVTFLLHVSAALSWPRRTAAPPPPPPPHFSCSRFTFVFPSLGGMRRTFYLLLLLLRLLSRRRPSTPSTLPSFPPSRRSSSSLSLSTVKAAAAAPSAYATPLGNRAAAAAAAAATALSVCLSVVGRGREAPLARRSAGGRPRPPALSVGPDTGNSSVRVLRRRNRMEAAQTEAKVLPL